MLSAVGPSVNQSSNDSASASIVSPSATPVPVLVPPAATSAAGVLPGFQAVAAISSQASVVSSQEMVKVKSEESSELAAVGDSESGLKRSAGTAGLDTNQSTGSCSSSLALDGDSRVRVWKERCFAASAVSSNSTGGANNETASGNSAALPTLDEATSILTGSAHSLSGKHHDITKRPPIPAKQITAAMAMLRQQQLQKARVATPSDKSGVVAATNQTGNGGVSPAGLTSSGASNSSTIANNGARTSLRRKEQLELQQQNQQIAKTATEGDNESVSGMGSVSAVLDASSSERQLEWVQCDACKKWRTLPAQSHPLYPKQLDEDKGWVCSMNAWAPHLASCAVPEESMLSATAVKIKVWLRRLRSGDRYDSKSRAGVGLSSLEGRRSMASAPLLRSSDVHWLRCGNPLCGRWRACIRSMTVNDIRTSEPFYCWMVSWDETRASCSAPQEGGSVTSFAIAMVDADINENGGANASSTGGSAAQNSSAAFVGGAGANSASAGASNMSSQRAGSSSGGSGRVGGSNASGLGYNANADMGADSGRISGASVGDGSISRDTGGNGGGFATAVNEYDDADGDGDADGEGEGAKTIGISSRGRIVRSKFNVRKHLAGSRK